MGKWLEWYVLELDGLGSNPSPATSWVTWSESLSLSASPSIKWGDKVITTIFHKVVRLKEIAHTAFTAVCDTQ